MQAASELSKAPARCSSLSRDVLSSSPSTSSEIKVGSPTGAMAEFVSSRNSIAMTRPLLVVSGEGGSASARIRHLAARPRAVVAQVIQPGEFSAVSGHMAHGLQAACCPPARAEKPIGLGRESRGVSRRQDGCPVLHHRPFRQPVLPVRRGSKEALA